MVEALIEQATYLTPTTLFLLLNAIIATLLISSAFTNHHRNNNSSTPPPTHQQLFRTPSLLFSRVASFNFTGRAQEPGQVEACGPSLLSSQEEVGEVDTQLDNNCSPAAHDVAVGGTLAWPPSLLSRLGSFRLSRQTEVGQVNTHFNVTKKVIRRQKTEVMEKEGKEKEGVMMKETTTFLRNEEKVDAKANDFINRFKEQLKLERIESLLRSQTA